MAVLITCKNEDQNKNESARVVTPLHINLIFRRFGAANSVVEDGIWPKFKAIKAFIVGLVTCKMEDPFKNEGTRVVSIFLTL